MPSLRNVRTAALAVVLAGTGTFMLLDSSPVSADDRICRGTIGARTIDDNVRVPQGATCTLNGTYVKGDVKAFKGARVELNNARVDGNVQTIRARRTIVRNRTVVDGNVQAKYGGSHVVKFSRVKGDVQYEFTRGIGRVRRTTVDGNVQIYKSPGGFGVWYNRIDGDLQCFENGTPRRGDGNRVQGNKQGQCRNR